MEPCVSGQSLVTHPRGRLWFVTRNTVYSLETVVLLHVRVCVSVCVPVGGSGLRMAKTHNCCDVTSQGHGLGKLP